MTRQAAVIGGGVIGGGWVARFMLMGWNVSVYDPDPEAERKLNEVLSNARASLPGLMDVAMPEPGTLTMCASIAEAVAGAEWITEAVPERLDLKHRIYAEIQASNPDAMIGSSTSGFKPSELQQGAVRPGAMVVTHPFNPVYLLPLAELVCSPETSDAEVEKAKEVLASIGMHAVHIKAEIDAHVGDRLLEAVWREALWLVKDGIATTEEIDDIIRYSFGLRWAQMGLFETYRIAGGEAGMRHFMAQFGPALKWPWTKLMDVPEFNDELVELIGSQSDAQSGMHTIRELERIRDRNLVTILRGLKAQDWGAGKLLKQQDARLAPPKPEMMGPVETLRRAVPLDWTDYNGHMNEVRYLQAFSDATDHFMALVGADADYISAGNSFFTAETHIRHLDEVHVGQQVRVVTLLLDGGGKKMHVFHRMMQGGRLVATGEQMLIHVSLETRKACEPLPAVAQKLTAIARAHAVLPRPEGIGRAVGVK